MITFMDRKVEEWQDIYCLVVFRGEEPRSLRDLHTWRAPLSPEGCLRIAFDLIEARQKYGLQAKVVAKWIERMLIEENLNPKK